MKRFKFAIYIALFLSLFVLLSPFPQSASVPTIADPKTEDSETRTETGAETQEETEPETETEAETETEPTAPRKRVAITYDDGPAFDNDSAQRLTYKLVDEFQKYGGTATFFVLGNRINASTGKAMQYAHERGFEFAIHAYTHDIYFDVCDEDDYLDELRQTKKAIQKYIDADVTLLRAPGGRITDERAALGGYPIINWSIDTEDWRYKSRNNTANAEANVNAIVENALRDVEEGDIILLHEIYRNSYEATCIILERLDEMGFEFVTVTELIGEDNLVAGKTYYRAS